MSRLYSYKLSRDYGFAPNPFHGICTLATCKPQIRSSAAVGDLIVGCGSQAIGLAGRLIYAMRVAEKITFQQYWEDPRFVCKRPQFTASMAQAFGDNIYHQNGAQWVQEDSHHSLDGGGLNNANLQRDTRADSVLIATDFVYWGDRAPSVPIAFRDLNKDDLYPAGRFYRCNFSPQMVDAVSAWFDSLRPRGYLGRPNAWAI